MKRRNEKNRGNAILRYLGTLTPNKATPICLVLGVMFSLFYASLSFGDLRDVPLSEQLATYGIDVKQLNQVKRAAESEPMFNVRILCIQYLASIKENIAVYLKDPNVRVRVTVAELLADAGQANGLPVMLEDYTNLLRNGMDKDRETFLKLSDRITSDRSLVYALEIGRVLAKLGHPRGLKLAKLAVVNAPLEAQRYRAIWVLEAIMKSARANAASAVLQNANQNAKTDLISASGQERSSLVLRHLVAAMDRVSGPDALEVLYAVQSSSNVPQARIAAAVAIDSVTKKERNRDR